jgi:hypothetical protein
MIKLEAEDVGAIATAASKAALEILESERKRANERIYGEKAILAELKISRTVFWRLVKRDDLPVDKDPFGISIRRWDVQRWLEGRRRAIECAKR